MQKKRDSSSLFFAACMYKVFDASGRSTSAHLSAVCCCCSTIWASIKFRLLFIAQTWNLKLTNNKLQQQQRRKTTTTTAAAEE